MHLRDKAMKSRHRAQRFQAMCKRAILKLIGHILIALSLLGCQDAQSRPNINDPSRYEVAPGIIWASPNGHDLTLDIYTPTAGTGPYPVIVLFHGGGWLINDQSIMTQSAQYLASNSRYVICNVNYRLLVDQDNTVSLTDIVNDAFGSVLWIKEFIDHYQGDSTRLIMTGDSAGAHLAAMMVYLGSQIDDPSRFGGQVWFAPSYPAASIEDHEPLDVQAAVLHYGVFDVYQFAKDGFERWFNPFWLMNAALGRGLFGGDFNVQEDAELYRSVSPIHSIPSRSDRALPPQLVTVGSEDPVVTPAAVKRYVQALRKAGQPVEYWEYEGQSHAYLDSGSSLLLGSSFEADAPKALDNMITFLDKIFYR